MKTTQSNSIDDLRFTIYGRLLVRSLILFGLLISGLWFSAHAAGPPEAMTFQGFLVDANGNPLATNNPANYPVTFRIFGAASGGASLWSEQQIVTVDKGNFSVILSEGTPVSGEPRPLLSTVLSTNGADRYIQITVTINGSPLDMLPRLRLLPSPYAFLSTSANQLVSPAGSPVLTYANSRVEVAGNLFVAPGGAITGNGSGLSGFTAAQIPALDASKITSGTLADARLSANVPRLSLDNAFQGNVTIGTGTSIGSTFPLTIGAPGVIGDKISLFGQSGDHYGFGIQPSLLQIHSSNPNADIAFGYGRSDAMVEAMRIKGNGNVGIGTNNPTARLEVNGGIKVAGSNVLEFGAGVAGKEVNAGKIGYGTFTPNTLDIVGAGSTAARKVKIHAEGGTEFSGPVSFNGEKPFHFATINGPPSMNGRVALNTGWSTNQYFVAVVGADANASGGGWIGEVFAYASGTTGTWWVQGEIRDNQSGTAYRIYYMRIAKGFVTDTSTQPTSQNF